MGDEEYVECFAEMIDGTYTLCGCPECQDREQDQAREAEEMGMDPWIGKY